MAATDEEPGVPNDPPPADGNITVGVTGVDGTTTEGDPPPPPPEPEPDPGPPDENYPPVDLPG